MTTYDPTGNIKDFLTNLKDDDVRAMYQELKGIDLNSDKVADKHKSLVQEEGVEWSLDQTRSFLGALNKMDFDQFKLYLQKSEIPAIQLSSQEMELVKGGMSTGGKIAVGYLTVAATVLTVFGLAT